MAKPKPKKEEKKVIPLKEQLGYCRECEGYSFNLRFSQGELMRKCNRCGNEITL